MSVFDTAYKTIEQSIRQMEAEQRKTSRLLEESQAGLKKSSEEMTRVVDEIEVLKAKKAGLEDEISKAWAEHSDHVADSVSKVEAHGAEADGRIKKAEEVEAIIEKKKQEVQELISQKQALVSDFISSLEELRGKANSIVDEVVQKLSIN